MSVAEIKAALISSFPPGVDGIVDWDDAPGKHIEAIAQTVQEYGPDIVDLAAKETNPLTAVENLPRYSRIMGLGSNNAGSVVQRRARLISRFRELGATTTVPQIQAVIAPLLDYADPTDLVVIQSDRAALRTAHTYAWTGSKTFTGTPAIIPWFVNDDADLSDAGAQVDITITHTDISKIELTLTSPNGVTATVAAGTLGHGAITAGTLRAYFDLPGAKVGGTFGGDWSLSISATSGTGTITAASLFVEGLGLDDVSKNEGLGAAVYCWGVMVEDDKLGPNADIEAARDALARIEYGARRASLLRRSVGAGALAVGDFASIPGDTNTIPNASLPGTAV